jgi:hypothetical protein
MPYTNLLYAVFSLWKYRNRQKFSAMSNTTQSTIANLAALAAFLISNDDFVNIMKYLMSNSRVGKRLWPILTEYYESFLLRFQNLKYFFFFLPDVIENNMFKSNKTPSPPSVGSKLQDNDRHTVLIPQMKELIWKFMLMHSEEGKSYKKFKSSFFLRMYQLLHAVFYFRTTIFGF